MTPLHRQILLKAFQLFDLLLMIVSFGVAFSSVVYDRIGVTSLADFLSMRIKIQNFVIFVGLLVLWYTVFALHGLYHSRRLTTRWTDIVEVIKATSVGSLLIWIIGVFLKIDIITPVFLAVFWGTSTATSVSTRLLLRGILERFRLRGRNLRHVLIVGTNNRAIEFARKIEVKPELGYRLIGFVDDEWHATEQTAKLQFSIVTNFKEFAAFLRDHVVDEVVIGLPMNSYYQQASKIVALCEDHGILIRSLSSLFNSKLARSRAEHTVDDPVITLYTGSMQGWPVLVKRIIDFALSLILLVVLGPLFIISAIIIRISSAGPVFFIQERVGLNKRRFRLYKFRTMVSGAEQKLAEIEHLNEVSGPVFKIKNDPRITPIGRFLRKTSIDELPQLFNVLKGDMSLVGPRPLPVRDYQGFDEDWLRRRFSVRPGITCLWQINGRSSVPFKKWMELDMQYIDEWSLTLDFKILAKTIPAVLRGSGAA